MLFLITHLVIFLCDRTRGDVVMPLMWPVKGVDGTDVQEIAVPKDTEIIISIFGANRDKRIWGPDAEEWKPERWLEPLPKSVADAHMPGVYASMSVLSLLGFVIMLSFLSMFRMTFIGGGRACM